MWDFGKKPKKNIIKEYKILIKKENWATYFGDITITENMLLEMKNISNDKIDDNIWKNYIDMYKKLYGDASILLRFKRDHKTQKRIQCAINYKKFMNEILSENTIL